MHIDKLIKIDEVIDQVGISHSQIYNLIPLGRFPAPIKVGGTNKGIGSRTARWSQNQIQDWIKTQIENSSAITTD